MPAEIILRGSFIAGYTLVDARTDSTVSEVFAQLQHALTAALLMGATAIWQQNLDGRGHAVGQPTLLVRPIR